MPPGFRFAVKLPREITHRRQLQPGELLAEFLKGPAALGDKLGALLVQLPPRLALDRSVAEAFFADLRRHFPGAVVCEPRHASWFSPEAEALLETFHIARAAADPALMPAAAEPGGWRGLSYYRLHGSPVMYRSAYPEDFLAQLAARLGEERAQRPVWCIFDNTTALSVVEDFCSRLAVLPYYPGGTPRVNKAPRGSPYLWS